MTASADHVATRQCAKRQPPTMAASYSAACAQTRTAKPTGSLQNATHGNRQNNKPPKSGTRLTTHYLNHMRFSRKRNFRSWTPRTSKLAHEAKARKRMEQPCERIDRPQIGFLLHTIRVESHLSGIGFEIKVKQAKRLNQVILETFGRCSKPVGIDKFVRHLRQKLVTRWIRE